MTDLAGFFCMDSSCWLNYGSADADTVPLVGGNHRGVKRSIDVASVPIEEGYKPTLTKENTQKEANWKTLYVIQKNHQKGSIHVSQAHDFDSYFYDHDIDQSKDDEGKRLANVQNDQAPGDKTIMCSLTTRSPSACYIVHDEESVSSIFRSDNGQEISAQQYANHKTGPVMPAATDYHHPIVQRC
mmetsp:Transcript_8807/g.11790  ORF Transcript_8807/g.11790 Transcript_8807/m.11790 type:complete len:185 (-) Transcript_8807:527-1081(-)